MIVLALDSALDRRAAAVVRAGALAAERHAEGDGPELAEMAAAVLAEAGIGTARLGLVAVTVGPGRFTGLRTALALAHGIGVSAGVPVVGVTVGEALAPALPHLGARTLWVAIDSRRGRVFLEQGGAVTAVALESLPMPPGPVAVAGDAAPIVAAWLAGRDRDVMLTDARYPMPRHVALAAMRRHAGELQPRDPLPLYVDPPAAALPASGLRPPPA